MPMQREKKIVKIEADWILPVSSQPFKDGAVVIEDDTIKAAGKKKDLLRFPCDELIDCSGKILMPGLVNAHAHLELTGFRDRITKGLPFADWAREVVSVRKGMNETDIASAIKTGVNELISSGVTAIGDFSQTGITGGIFKEKGLKGTVFIEFAGFNSGQKDERMRELKEKVDRFFSIFNLQSSIRIGIAPHAPYSVSKELLKESNGFAKQNRLPFAIHISEMLEEMDFIKNGSGAMRDLLIDFGVWNDKWDPPKTTPVQYLHNLGILKEATGIHLNIISEDDIRMLKGNNVSAVYCPGSNRWFGRNWKYPLMELLNNDINVAIGTDSMASNEQLNMFYEMRTIKENFPEIDNNTILKMATINGAKAIGFEGKTGEIAAGKKADIIGIDIKDSSIKDPADYVINNAEKVSFGMVNGEAIFMEG